MRNKSNLNNVLTNSLKMKQRRWQILRKISENPTIGLSRSTIRDRFELNKGNYLTTLFEDFESNGLIKVEEKEPLQGKGEDGKRRTGKVAKITEKGKMVVESIKVLNDKINEERWSEIPIAEEHRERLKELVEKNEGDLNEIQNYIKKQEALTKAYKTKELFEFVDDNLSAQIYKDPSELDKKDRENYHEAPNIQEAFFDIYCDLWEEAIDNSDVDWIEEDDRIDRLWRRLLGFRDMKKTDERSKNLLKKLLSKYYLERGAFTRRIPKEHLEKIVERYIESGKNLEGDATKTVVDLYQEPEEDVEEKSKDKETLKEIETFSGKRYAFWKDILVSIKNKSDLGHVRYLLEKTLDEEDLSRDTIHKIKNTLVEEPYLGVRPEKRTEE